MLKDLKKTLPKDKNKRFAIVLIALLALPITVVLVQRVVRYFTGAASATIYFEPSSADLPPDKTLRLMVDSGSTKVGFARVEVNFDNTKVRLTSEISTTGMLTMNNADVSNTPSLPQDACTGTQKCIIKTPMTSANNTGKIVLVLAKDPRVSTNAPSGIFELANFTFTTHTSNQVSTNVTIPSNQLVDMNVQKFSVSPSSATLHLNGGGGSPTPTLGGQLISNLVENGSGTWNLMTNLSVGDTQYSDRDFKFTSVSSNVAGASWIQTSNESKSYTGSTLATFQVNSDATVYVASDDRISKPSWLSGWSDSGSNLVNSESNPKTFSLYGKDFSSGQTVNLGPSGSTSFGMYTVVVVAGVVATSTPTPVITFTPTPTLSPTPTISPDECSDVPGDVSGDGRVNVSDIIKIIAVYQSSPPDNPCADLNGDDRVNVSDIILVISYYP